MKRMFALLLVAGCGPLEAEALVEVDAPVSDLDASLKPRGEDRSDTVDIGCWNVEWLGEEKFGPKDEALQQANVTRVLRQLNLDLMGLVEVVSPAAFANVLGGLPDHRGLLVTDPGVEGGAQFYGASEQKVALVFRKRFKVESARVVLSHAQWDFAGRPPMEVKLSFTENGRARTLVVIVAHFKAMADWEGWTRRTAASKALESFLDAEHAGRWVLVVGDFNDDLDVSTWQQRPSPFANFVGDPRYRFTTDRLTQQNLATTVSFSSTIDHHLATAPLAERFIENSAAVLKMDSLVPGYATNTSDHWPVLTRYDLR